MLLLLVFFGIFLIMGWEDGEFVAGLGVITIGLGLLMPFDAGFRAVDPLWIADSISYILFGLGCFYRLYRMCRAEYLAEKAIG